MEGIDFFVKILVFVKILSQGRRRRRRKDEEISILRSASANSEYFLLYLVSRKFHLFRKVHIFCRVDRGILSK